MLAATIMPADTILTAPKTNPAGRKSQSIAAGGLDALHGAVKNVIGRNNKNFY